MNVSRPTLDPVCGQTIEPVRARAVMIYGQEIYYFCCQEHKERFQAEPTKFLATGDATETEAGELLGEAPPVELDAGSTAEGPLPAADPPAPLPEAALPPATEPEPDVGLISLLSFEPRAEPTLVELRFEIGGMAEKADAERVRRAIEKVPGVHTVAIDLLTEVATVTADPSAVPSRLVDAASQAGFEATLRRHVSEDQAALAAKATAALRRTLLAVGLALLGAVLLAGSVRAPLVHFLLGAAAVFGPGASLFGAWPPRHSDRPHAMLVGILALLVLALVQAVGGRNTFPQGLVATVLSALALVGRLIEVRALARAAAALVDVERVRPTHACRVRKGAPAERVSVDALVPGDLLRVGGGEVVPADGVIRVGEGMVDETLLSAQRVALLRAPGDVVVAGTELVSGTLILEVRRAGRDTVVARLYAALREAQSSEGALGRLARRGAAWTWPVSLGLAVVALLVHVGILARGLDAAVSVFAAVACASCPTALALSVQVALALATSRAADRGILFRNAEAMERTHEVAWLAAGKNGTLTLGRPRVVAHAVTLGTDEGRLLALAAAAERAAETPLGRAVRAYVEARQLPAPPAERALYLPGLGVSAVVAGTPVAVGSQRFLEREGVSLVLDPPFDLPRGDADTSVLYVALDGKLAGALAVSDPVRDEARAFVEGLSKTGLAVVLVTGEDQAAAGAVAQRAGITQVHAALRPDEKKHAVVSLRRPGRAVAALGDGVEDASTLAAADVGIVLGGGVEPVLEAGAITVLRGQLGDVAAALALGRRAVGIMRQNVAGTLGASILGTALFAVLPLGAAGPLWAAALSTIVLTAVVANSLRAEAPGPRLPE
jgi:Cu+-exporting ATPase